MNKLYVRELNVIDFNKVKDACVVALSELDQIEFLDDALDSRLCDLSDLIDVSALNIDLYKEDKNL